MKQVNEHGTPIQTTGVHGVLITMSEGLYAPFIEVEVYATGQRRLCNYNSELSRDAGLDNPKHWAHAVYRTLERLCRDHQAELQGGSMAAYEETEADRATARAAEGGRP